MSQYYRLVPEVKKQNALLWPILLFQMFSIFPFPLFAKGKGEENAIWKIICLTKFVEIGESSLSNLNNSAR